MDILLENDYFILEQEKENSIFIYAWKSNSENLKLKGFLAEAQKILEIALKSGCTSIIGNDTELNFSMPPELQVQINKTVITKLNGVINYFAHILSKDYILQLAAEQLFEENTEKTYEEKYFHSLEEAKEWIYSKQ